MEDMFKGVPKGYAKVYGNYDLKPCPFCGSEKVYLIRSGSMFNYHAILCQHCGADVIFSKIEHSAAKTAEKWNNEPKEDMN